MTKVQMKREVGCTTALSSMLRLASVPIISMAFETVTRVAVTTIIATLSKL